MLNRFVCSSQDPTSEWLPFRDIFLDELLRHEGLGERQCDNLMCEHCGEKPGTLKCPESHCIGSPLLCQTCMVIQHKHLPLHPIQVRLCFESLELVIDTRNYLSTALGSRTSMFSAVLARASWFSCTTWARWRLMSERQASGWIHDGYSRRRTSFCQALILWLSSPRPFASNHSTPSSGLDGSDSGASTNSGNVGVLEAVSYIIPSRQNQRLRLLHVVGNPHGWIRPFLRIGMFIFTYLFE